MLREISNVRQEGGAGFRRWFESDALELIVWFSERSEVMGFQICYDLGDGDHALTWRPATGFAHSTIDSGEDDPFFNRTPILEPDGAVPWQKLATVFDENSGTLAPELRSLIRQRLNDRSGAVSVS